MTDHRDPNWPSQYPADAQQNAPQKKPWYKRAIIMIPLTLLVLFILFVGGCMAMIGGVANEVDKQSKEEHQITYSIEGDAQDANVTYTTDGTNTAQDNGVAAGWTKDVTHTGFFAASLIATNGMGDTGTITCKIMSNGKVLSENTATGEFASASCNTSSTDLENATKN